jgi:thiamine biosynthesis lipoprotein
MGTYYTVTLAEPPADLDWDALQGAVQQEFDKIDALMSTYRADSELSQLNGCKAGEWFPVSAETATVLEEALRIGRLTDGAFDVTVGPLVNLWNFGPEKEAGAAIPATEEIEKVRERVGLQHLEVRTSPPAVKKGRDDLYVDLSGIAKGYAVDRVAALLAERKFDGFKVDVGGDLYVQGRVRKDEPWKIGVEAPTADVFAIQQVVLLEDFAIATSGDYRNFFERDGTRYSHIIDPRSGKPVAHALGSASVLASSCAEADALATAMMVLGPEEGYNLAVREKLPVLLITRTEDGFADKASPALEERLRRSQNQ